MHGPKNVTFGECNNVHELIIKQYKIYEYKTLKL